MACRAKTFVVNLHTDGKMNALWRKSVRRTTDMLQLPSDFAMHNISVFIEVEVA
jgi:hypothetical protein